VWSALPITISRDVLHGWDTPTPTVTGYVTRTLRSCPQCTNLQSMASVTYNLKLHVLRLVAKIAMGYRGYGLPISEVVSEGNVGLMQAVKHDAAIWFQNFVQYQHSPRN
jgi:hypothetical protein